MNGDGLADMLIGTFSNTTGAIGKAYVVYGKADGTAVDLSSVAAGTGGFVINGVSANDWTGFAVSSAGDINGDGLSDLIVGTALANGGAGAAYVIFGGTQFATKVDFMGTGGDDIFVLNANNVAALQSPLGSNSLLARVDGGAGIDTIQLSGGANLNLTQVSNAGAGTPNGFSRINSVEIIDLKTDTSANTLTLTAKDVVDMSGFNNFNSSNTALVSGTALASAVNKHQVVVYGNALDTVSVGISGWTNSGTVVNYGGHNLVVYNSNTSASQLLIEQAMVTAGHVL